MQATGQWVTAARSGGRGGDGGGEGQRRMHEATMGRLPCAWGAANQGGGQGMGDEGKCSATLGRWATVVDVAEREKKEKLGLIRVRVRE